MSVYVNVWMSCISPSTVFYRTAELFHKFRFVVVFIMVSSPPITMGGLTCFRAKNVGGRNFVFPSHGGTKAVGGTSHYNGGTFHIDSVPLCHKHKS